MKIPNELLFNILEYIKRHPDNSYNEIAQRIKNTHNITYPGEYLNDLINKNLIQNNHHNESIIITPKN